MIHLNAVFQNIMHTEWHRHKYTHGVKEYLLLKIHFSTIINLRN